MTINISKGRYWDEGVELVSGCTPCSPGCEHCWSSGIAHRFAGKYGRFENATVFTNENGKFDGTILVHPDRLKRFNTRKPKVFAIWNDLFHENIDWQFIYDAYDVFEREKRHMALILTKRPQNMKDFIQWREGNKICQMDNIWHGLTICNQQEADEKIPIFLQVPGKKFLSIEPMLGPIDFRKVPGFNRVGGLNLSEWSVILGGETGPGARPMNPDWVRSVRDQCAAAFVPFFFKGWGKWGLNWMNDDNGKIEGSEWMDKGIKHPGRLLDGRTHDDLPWVKA